MHQSNKIILTDVDGVLLEWEKHFRQWMMSRGFTLRKGAEKKYSMIERYGIKKELKESLIEEFNKSAWMSIQEPMPDSQTWVKLLHAEGWTFIPITSQTTDIPAQELRKKRLKELFGGTVFENFIILDTGAHKDAALAEFHGTNLWWIEDKWSNAKKGLEFGLRPLIYNHTYNQKFYDKKITRVNNWKHIYQIINK
jgi:FMN phosphatase YigB (HAD superfamily)